MGLSHYERRSLNTRRSVTNWTEDMDRALIEAADEVDPRYRHRAAAWDVVHKAVLRKTRKFRYASACKKRFEMILDESDLAYRTARVAISLRRSIQDARLAERRD